MFAGVTWFLSNQDQVAPQPRRSRPRYPRLCDESCGPKARPGAARFVRLGCNVLFLRSRTV